MPRLRNTVSGVVVSTSDDTAAKLGRGWEPVDGSHPSAYDDLTIDKLKDEIRSRNESRDEDDRLLLSGSKSELVTSLEEDDG